MYNKFSNLIIPEIQMPSDTQSERKSLSQYDQQPTIMLLGSNRQSLHGTSFRQKTKPQRTRKNHTKLVTCESNLIESSPQRNDPQETDGQFLCKYLTPIKKQQFDRLLIHDQINENLDQHIKYQTEIQYKKNLKQEQKNKYHNVLTEQPKCKNLSNMIESFDAFETFNKNQEITSTPNQVRILSNCKCASKSPNLIQTSSVFIDPLSQVLFLKANNQQLYTKLQKQIEKNKGLQSKISELEISNKRLNELNIKYQAKLMEMKEAIKKYQIERKSYLAKELQQFQFVQQFLIEKRQSKGRKSYPKKIEYQPSKNNEILKQINKKINQDLIQTEKNKVFRKTTSQQRQLDSVKVKGFASGRATPSLKLKTVQSENQFQRLQNTTNRNISIGSSTAKKKVHDNKQNKLLQKFLIGKLSENRAHQIIDKKPQLICPSQKTFKKNEFSGKRSSCSTTKI